MTHWVTDRTIGTVNRAHDAPIDLPQGFDQARFSKFSSGWGKMGTGNFNRVEWRAALFGEFGNRPTKDFRVFVSDMAYWSFGPSGWLKEFEVTLRPSGSGGYLGNPATPNVDPYSQPNRGLIAWRDDGDGVFSAPWNTNARLMHWWASKRHPIRSGQTAELATMTIWIGNDDGQFLDLDHVTVLGGCGVDYYNGTENNHRAPGPGIQRMVRIGAEPVRCAWLTTPPGVIGFADTDLAAITKMDQWIIANNLPIPPTDAPLPDPPIIVNPPIIVKPPTVPPVGTVEVITKINNRLDELERNGETYAARFENIGDRIAALEAAVEVGAPTLRAELQTVRDALLDLVEAIDTLD